MGKSVLQTVPQEECMYWAVSEAVQGVGGEGPPLTGRLTPGTLQYPFS